MDEILKEVLEAKPDLLLLQEVVVEMYAVLRRRLSGWKLHRRHDHAEVRTHPASAMERSTSYAFPTSNNGRHLLTARRDGWAIVNVHAESGRHQEERDQRVAQLEYMSRVHEREDDKLWILAGDFNAREGEDHCLLSEGWREVGAEALGLEPWTWRRSQSSARYDRVCIHDGGGESVQLVSASAIRTIWGGLTDHVALRVVVRRMTRGAAVRIAMVDAAVAPWRHG